MRYTVVVMSITNPPFPFVYGPFYTMRDAAFWAEKNLAGRNWEVGQYIDVTVMAAELMGER